MNMTLPLSPLAMIIEDDEKLSTIYTEAEKQAGFTTQAIRADQRLSKTKVIITTADPITAETLEQEGDLVLIKPVSFNQLRDLAYRLVKTRIE